MPKKLIPKSTSAQTTPAPGDSATLNNPRYNAGREQVIYDYLRGRGVGAAQAAGLMGNLAVESWLNADLKQVGGGPAYGLPQMEGGRQKAMRTYNEVPYAFGSKLTPEEQQQLDYMIDKGFNSQTPGEWRYGHGFNKAADARKALLNAQTAREASDIITRNYLRPGKPHLKRRRAMSDYYYDKYTPKIPFTGGFMWDGSNPKN